MYLYIINSGKCSTLGQIERKIQKCFKVKKSLNPQKNIRISSTLQGFILEISLIALGSLKRSNSYFLCVSNNFFYTQAAFYVLDNTNVFFPFLLQ